MSKSWRGRAVKILIGVGGALFLASQLVPAPRTNPPVTGLVDAPPAAMEVLRRSCWDCHSNETVWPWYSKVGPVKFLIVRDVNEGRKHLNFSEWDRRSPERRAHALEEIVEETSEGEMPLWFYLPLHPEAELTQADLRILRDWALASGVSLEAGGEREHGEHEHGHDD